MLRLHTGHPVPFSTYTSLSIVTVIYRINWGDPQQNAAHHFFADDHSAASERRIRIERVGAAND
jgi:hypothetical protein